MAFPADTFWRDKRTLVTGNLGFKGSWTAFWLSRLGAEVFGFDKNSDIGETLYGRAKLPAENCHTGDITNALALDDCVRRVQPQIIFHMAAQPLVKDSYLDPSRTFLDNVQGTINLLEAVRSSTVEVCICVTSDKVYQNKEWLWPYREDEPLGGHDPYSASKAACDIAVQSYVRSYFSPGAANFHRARVCTVRAGNVIGGGDWARDRLIPDAVRAFRQSKSLEIRNPAATRPWQHVLEPIAGYLLLAEHAYREPSLPFAAWNFGPHSSDVIAVSAVLDLMLEAWGEGARYAMASTQEPRVHEAGRLNVDSSRAIHHLGWKPRWSVDRAVERVTAWYKGDAAGMSNAVLMDDDVAIYSRSTGS